MASINGVSGNNLTSSLYNSANVISGLASGLDTESMIEGLVQSYQKKIQDLSNKSTKLEWKQEAYRSIITKMNAFASKYTSYSSSTNLMSASFFNSATKVAAQGKYADKVTASGRTDSSVKLNSVKQLADAARYTTKSSLDIGSDFAITAEDGVKFTDTVEMGTLSGSMTFDYGGKTVSIVFDPNKDMIDNNLSAGDKAKALGDMIREKLDDAKVTLSTGETKSASELIDVSTDASGRISFKDKSSGGNSVYISGASDSVKETLRLDLEKADEKKPATFQVGASTQLTQTPTVASLISGKAMNISLDGRSKTIFLPKVARNGDGSYTLTPPTLGKDKDGNTTLSYDPQKGKKVSEKEYADAYAAMVNDEIQKEFGQKITVSNVGTADEKGVKSLQLKIQAPENSSLVVNSDAGKALGIGNSATNYLNTGKTLGELIKDDKMWDGLPQAKDEKGKPLKDEDGNQLYAFVINGKTVGNYSKESKLSDIMNDINNSDAGVKVSYSQTTRAFTFTSKETGAEYGIEMGEGLAQALFQKPMEPMDSSDTLENILGKDHEYGDSFKMNIGGKAIEIGLPLDKTSMKEVTIDELVSYVNGAIGDQGMKASFDKDSNTITVTDKDGKKVNVEYEDETSKALFAPSVEKGGIYTAGKDAIFQVEVNGQTLDMTRATNSANIDGLTINFKSTFEAEDGDEISFQTSTDSDKIVDAVKSMIADYNEMMSEIRGQYATLPYQSSNGSFKTYEPLSDEDKAGMSESAIKSYEEKAKQGLLFSDSNLSTLYERMRSVFAPGGTDEALLRQMGITMTYSSSDGSSSITLDESKLREMLESDPDAVADIFTSASSSGEESNGIMQGLKVQLDRYAGITGANKGILVQQAGTPLSSLTLMNNNWQNQIDGIYTDIEKWQDKLSAQVDKYTSMFSKLETLIYQMNSQSSTLAGLMGG